MDLELTREEDTELKTQKGVKRGIAKRVVGDIDEWVQNKRYTLLYQDYKKF
jgi:hypothetical protein